MLKMDQDIGKDGINGETKKGKCLILKCVISLLTGFELVTIMDMVMIMAMETTRERERK
jgi:hypothetical protein